MRRGENLEKMNDTWLFTEMVDDDISKVRQFWRSKSVCVIQRSRVNKGIFHPRSRGQKHHSAILASGKDVGLSVMDQEGRF